jgi:hypothetical protein
MPVVAGRDDKPQRRKVFLNNAVFMSCTGRHVVLAYQTKKQSSKWDIRKMMSHIEV